MRGGGGDDGVEVVGCGGWGRGRGISGGGGGVSYGEGVGCGVGDAAFDLCGVGRVALGLVLLVVDSYR